MRARSWSQEDLTVAVSTSFSYRQVIQKLGLIPAGGNYSQVKRYIAEQGIGIRHFKGKGWNKGLTGTSGPQQTLEDILKRGSYFQSYKLKNRLFDVGLKTRRCEECGWAEESPDGRIPLELDHINGDSMDNRLVNLRVLCPNCHSLKPTHRGRNKKS
jgi:hypothetical protein